MTSDKQAQQEGHRMVPVVESHKETFAVGANGKLVPFTGNRFPSLFESREAVFVHEVRNVLTVILSALQFVERELEAKQVQDRALTAVIEGGVEAIDRAGSLLDEFRSPAHFQTTDFVSTDLVRVVQEVLALEIVVCRAVGIEVKFEIEDAVPRVRLNARKIKQAILNLCKNAIEAMPKGGCLTLKVYRSGPTVVLEISDNGIGLPDSVNIFELFQTTKAGGTGIGLFLVQQIVSEHNAAITCTSKAGRGTTFKVVFPAAD
jgi:signal transduction histidine kinase